MIRFVCFQHLLRLLQGKPPPFSHRLLPQLLRVQGVNIEDKHLGPVTLLRVLKLPEVSAKLT